MVTRAAQRVVEGVFGREQRLELPAGRFFRVAIPGTYLSDLVRVVPDNDIVSTVVPLTLEGLRNCSTDAKVRIALSGSEIPIAPSTPNELVQEMFLHRLGLIPESHFLGVGDVVSCLPKPPAPSADEIAAKRARFSGWLGQRNADYLLLSDLNVQDWLLGGLDFHEITNTSVAKFLVPADPQEPVHIIISNIEAPRITAEEMEGGIGQDWDQHVNLVVHQWDEKPRPYIESIVGERTILNGTDDQSFHDLHYSFLPQDTARYEWLAQVATAALVKQGHFLNFGRDTEAEVASRINGMLAPHEIFPEVLLVAGDDKVSRTNHPLPREGAVINDYAIMVLCARYRGYVVNVSRFVHNGAVSDELVKKTQLCGRIALQAYSETVPGATFGNVFSNIVAQYGANGVGGAEKECHQGGPAGIGIRDFLATADNQTIILPFQPVTWNPMIPGNSVAPGVKVEDTIMTGMNSSSKSRVLTIDPYGWWPMWDAFSGGDYVIGAQIPGILQR